jgi:hypothetical protein
MFKFKYSFIMLIIDMPMSGQAGPSSQSGSRISARAAGVGPFPGLVVS